jgi:hypothetical protein
MGLERKLPGLIGAGHSLDEIADETGLTWGEIRSVLVAQNLPINEPFDPQGARAHNIRLMKERGHTRHQIMRECGYSRAYLARVERIMLQES